MNSWDHDPKDHDLDHGHDLKSVIWTMIHCHDPWSWSGTFSWSAMIQSLYFSIFMYIKKSVHVFGELLYLRYVVLVSLVLFILLKSGQIREERSHFYLTMPHTKKCCHGIILHGQPATGHKLGVIWTIGSWSMSMIRATWTHMIHDHDPGNWFDEDHGSWSWSDHCANVDHDHPKSMVMIQNPHEFLPVVFWVFWVFWDFWVF